MICLANNLLWFHSWKLNSETEERLYTLKTYENCISKITGSLAKHELKPNFLEYINEKIKKQVVL